MLEKVISGGQTGVDQAGLFAARKAGLETGGWAPKGWKTEKGPAPWLAKYGLVEHESEDYPARRMANVRDSDFTMILGDPRSKGSLGAISDCIEADKTVLLVSGIHVGREVEVRGRKFVVVRHDAQSLIRTIDLLKAKVVNVAGNRESSNPGIGVAAERFLTLLFLAMKENS